MNAHVVISAILLFLVLPLAGSEAANGQEVGVVQGQLVNGTGGAGKPGPWPVALLVYQGNEERGRLDGAADEQGRFRFEGLAVAPEAAYQVSVQYQGVSYISEPTNLHPEASKWLELRVYETTQERNSIQVEAVSLALMKADPQQGTLTLLEVYTFNNSSDRTYLARFGESEGGPPLLRFPLPPDAFDLTLGHGLTSANVAFVDGGFATDIPLLPGRNDIIFAYRLPYITGQYSLSTELLYPTPSFTLLIPDDGIRAIADTLTPQSAAEFQGQRFLVFTARDLPEKSQMAIQLVGLPRGPGSRSQGMQDALKLSTPVLMLAVAAAVWVYGGRSRPQAAGERRAVLEEQKGRLLRAIVDLDAAYDKQELPESEYRARRQEAKGQLVAALRQLGPEHPRDP